MIPGEIPQINKSGLFKKKFSRDLIFVLSMLAVAMVSYSTANDSGNFRYFRSGDWIAIVVDVLIASLSTLLMFGIGPAIFRRSRLRNQSRDLIEKSLPMSRYIGISFAVALVASVIGLFNPNDNFPNIPAGLTQAECRLRGVDEVCMEVTYEGNKKLSYFTTWKYSTEKMISGQNVSKITWEVKIDCSDDTGMVLDLNAFDGDGNSVEIGEVKSQMIDGINKSEVQPLIGASCN